MKILVQLQTDLDNPKNKIINRCERIYDSENFITSIIDVDEPQVGENEYITYEWDIETQKVIAKALPIPKTENELLKEEIEMLKGSIIDLTMLTLGE